MKKGRSIRNKMTLIIVNLCVVAVVFTAAIAGLIMERMQVYAKNAQVTQMENNYYDLVINKANLTDTILSGYAQTVDELVEYLHELYLIQDRLPQRNYSEFRDRVFPGNLQLQQYFLNEDYTEEDFEEEAGLLSYAINMFYPIMATRNGVVTSIYLGTVNGEALFFDDPSLKIPKKIYNFHNSHWYTPTKNAGERIFTDIYDDSFGRGMTLTCAAPFYDENNEFAGVVAMDVLFHDLYQEVMELSQDTGTPVLVDSSGRVIREDTLEELFLDYPEMDEYVAGEVLTGKTGIALTKHGVYCAYTPLDYTSWKYCILTSQDRVLGSVMGMRAESRRYFLFFGFIILTVVLLVPVFTTKFTFNLTQPLIHLKEEAQVISAGQFDRRVDIHTKDEIQDLAEAFNQMAEDLRVYVHDITKMTAEKERLSTELKVAAKIQLDMLPREFPAFPEMTEFDLYATMDPAKEVGGDFYDFFLLDDDHLCLVIADVSGKGVPAALFMAKSKALIKNRSLMGDSPEEVLAYVNEQLTHENEAELFVTVWMGVLTISTGEGVAVNAGHENPVLRRANGDYELVIYRHSLAVAAMEGIKFRSHPFQMYPGDALFVYTDGVAEATNEVDEAFGTDRLLRALNAAKDLSQEEILLAVKRDMDVFVGEADQFDDITMLGLTYYGAGGKESLPRETGEDTKEDEGAKERAEAEEGEEMEAVSEADHRKTSEEDRQMESYELPASLDKLDDVLDFSKRWLKKLGCPQLTCFAIYVAVEEIFVNIAHYAYPGKEGKAIVQIEDTKGPGVRFVFKDWGTPYNPLAKPDPDVTLGFAERKIGGLGIYMVKKSMENCTYEWKDGMNILSFEKSFVPDKKQGDE